MASLIESTEDSLDSVALPQKKWLLCRKPEKESFSELMPATNLIVQEFADFFPAGLRRDRQSCE